MLPPGPGAEPFRLAVHPERVRNPYLTLFYDALVPAGVEVAGDFLFSPRWLVAHRHRLEGVHIHWPEWLWARDAVDPPARALLKLKAFLTTAGRLGLRRLWTVHNLQPHEGARWADHVGFRLLARGSDLIICHSPEVASAVVRRLRPRGRVVVVPHGNYDGWYPPPRPREAVLGELGLDPARPVLAAVGRLRAYKGLDLACAAVQMLPDTQLVIAGAPHPGFDLGPLQAHAAAHPRTRLVLRAVSDQEFADLVAASDAVLLPYRHITGSGALLAAWTFGRGVVASDLPFFREMLPDGSSAGRLFRTGDTAALREALHGYLRLPAEERTRAARAEAERYAWSRCVGPVAAAVSTWRGAPSPAQPPGALAL